MMSESFGLTDSFSNGEVAHSDALYGVWVVPSSAHNVSAVKEVSGRGLVLLGEGATIVTSSTVLNALKSRSEIEFRGVRVHRDSKFSISALADRGGRSWRVTLSISADGHVSLAESRNKAGQ